MPHDDGIEPAHFVGKTIACVDVTAINAAHFYFTDGSSIAIEGESFGNGLMGMVTCDCTTEDAG